MVTINTEHYIRLLLLNAQGATPVLRETLTNFVKQTSNKTLGDFLLTFQGLFKTLKAKHRLGEPEYNKLLQGSAVDINEWDTSLLCFVLLNCCTLQAKLNEFKRILQKEANNDLDIFMRLNKTSIDIYKGNGISEEQYNIMFPANGNPTDKKLWDMSLITFILINVCAGKVQTCVLELRRILQTELELKTSSLNLTNFLKCHVDQLRLLKASRKLSESQFEDLFPSSGILSDIYKWDTNTLRIVVMNCTSSLCRQSVQATKKLREIRNKCLAHREKAEMDNLEYRDKSKDLTDAIDAIIITEKLPIKSKNDKVIKELINGPIDIKSALDILKDCYKDSLSNLQIMNKLDIIELKLTSFENRMISAFQQTDEGIGNLLQELLKRFDKLEKKIPDSTYSETAEIKCVNMIIVVKSKSVDVKRTAENIIKTAMENAGQDSTEKMKAALDVIRTKIIQDGRTIVEIKSGSIIITIKCTSIKALHGLLRYIASDDIESHLQTLASAVTELVGESIELTVCLSEQSVLIACEDVIRIMSGYISSTSSLRMTIRADTDEALQRMVDEFKGEHITSQLQSLSEGLTTYLGEDITVDVVVPKSDAKTNTSVTNKENKKTDDKHSEESFAKQSKPTYVLKGVGHKIRVQRLTLSSAPYELQGFERIPGLKPSVLYQNEYYDTDVDDLYHKECIENKKSDKTQSGDSFIKESPCNSSYSDDGGYMHDNARHIADDLVHYARPKLRHSELALPCNSSYSGVSGFIEVQNARHIADDPVYNARPKPRHSMTSPCNSSYSGVSGYIEVQNARVAQRPLPTIPTGCIPSEVNSDVYFYIGPNTTTTTLADPNERTNQIRNGCLAVLTILGMLVVLAGSVAMFTFRCELLKTSCHEDKPSVESMCNSTQLVEYGATSDFVCVVLLEGPTAIALRQTSPRPDKQDVVVTKLIDGRTEQVIQLRDNVEVNVAITAKEVQFTVHLLDTTCLQTGNFTVTVSNQTHAVTSSVNINLSEDGAFYCPCTVPGNLGDHKNVQCKLEGGLNTNISVKLKTEKSEEEELLALVTIRQLLQSGGTIAVDSMNSLFLDIVQVKDSYSFSLKFLSIQCSVEGLYVIVFDNKRFETYLSVEGEGETMVPTIRTYSLTDNRQGIIADFNIEPYTATIQCTSDTGCASGELKLYQFDQDTNEYETIEGASITQSTNYTGDLRTVVLTRTLTKMDVKAIIEKEKIQRQYRIACKFIDGMGIEYMSEKFQVRVIPGDLCTRSNISPGCNTFHPYDCTKFIECTDDSLHEADCVTGSGLNYWTNNTSPCHGSCVKATPADKPRCG